jgi:hypothetical protein
MDENGVNQGLLDKVNPIANLLIGVVDSGT